MGDLFLDGCRIGDDGRNAYGRDDLPELTPLFADNGALDAALAELQAAAAGTVHACDLARVGFWKTQTGWGLLERLVPGLICLPAGEADARRMEAMAEHLGSQTHLTSTEARDCRALRLYAAEVRAERAKVEAA